MKQLKIVAVSFALLLTVSGVYANLPTGALHVVSAGKSEISVRPGDYIQLEHTYLVLESPPTEAFANSSEKRHVALVKTLRVINPKALGVERATVGALFQAETPGRSMVSLEVVERNGRRVMMTCVVDVR